MYIEHYYIYACIRNYWKSFTSYNKSILNWMIMKIKCKTFNCIKCNRWLIQWILEPVNLLGNYLNGEKFTSWLKSF